MRKIFPFLIILFCSSAHAASFSGTLDFSLPKNARWALSVFDIDKGQEIIHTGTAADAQLVPGSLIKIFVAGAVLDEMTKGKTITLSTALFVGNAGGKDGAPDIFIRGRGNPFLSVGDLRKAVKDLKQKGIKRVGNIIVDDGYFDASGLSRKRSGPGYAPPAALGLDLHTVYFSVVPSEDGKPPTIKTDPNHEDIRFSVSALSYQGLSADVKVKQIDDLSYSIMGNIPVASSPLKWRFALRDPALFAGGVMKTVLREEGIGVRGDIRRGNLPPNAVSVVEINGPPLDKVLRDMNFHSLNVVADNLFLALGVVEFGPPGSLEKGRMVLDQFLATMTADSGDFHVADGSGLSSENRVTARSLSRFMATAAKRGWFRDFLETLPRIGRDGTVASMEYINDGFRAKTGILEDVFALAGYGTDEKGRRIAFAYIVNVPGASAMGLERNGREVLRYLSSEYLYDRIPATTP